MNKRNCTFLSAQSTRRAGVWVCVLIKKLEGGIRAPTQITVSLSWARLHITVASNERDLTWGYCFVSKQCGVAAKTFGDFVRTYRMLTAGLANAFHVRALKAWVKSSVELNQRAKPRDFKNTFIYSKMQIILIKKNHIDFNINLFYSSFFIIALSMIGISIIW